MIYKAKHVKLSALNITQSKKSLITCPVTFIFKIPTELFKTVKKKRFITLSIK